MKKRRTLFHKNDIDRYLINAVACVSDHEVTNGDVLDHIQINQRAQIAKEKSVLIFSEEKITK